ncbi:MAG: hypothetical protein RJA81_355, partial [Planctomycetota bacterium]
WDRMNGIKSLDVPTGFSGSVATQISEDGQWIVGIVNSSLGDQPALWDKDGNATLMQNHGIWSRALSLADAGELGMIKTGVSWENSDSQEKTAVIWDDLNQSSDLLRILRYQNATGIDQWESLNEATAVRYDPLTGLNIIGYGTINGESRGFLIQGLTTTVPETRSWVMGLIGIAFAVLMKYKNRYDPDGIRTRAAAVKGRCPRPLDDGAFKIAIRTTRKPEAGP